jgi:hypothetical protein
METAIGKVSNYLVMIYNWFQDFQGNVAPLIIWFTLMKFKVTDFFTGFTDGINEAFITVKKFIVPILNFYKGFLNMFSPETKKTAKEIGHSLGKMVTYFAGFKIFWLLSKPIRWVLAPLITLIQLTSKFIFLNRITNGLLTKTFKLIWKGAKGAVRQIWLMFKSLVSLEKQLRTTSSAWGRFIKYLRFARGAMLKATLRMWGLNTAMLANPVGLVVLAVAALVGYIYLLVTHWSELQEKTQSMSDGLLLFVALFAPIIGVPLLLAKYWKEFSTIFVNLWKTMKNVTIGVWAFIKQKFYSMLSVFVKFGQYMEKKFPKIFSVFKTIGNFLKKWIIDPIMWLLNKVDFIGDVLGKVVDWTTNLVSSSEDFRKNQEAKAGIEQAGYNALKMEKKAAEAKRTNFVESPETVQGRTTNIQQLTVVMPENTPVTGEYLVETIQQEMDKQGM